MTKGGARKPHHQRNRKCLSFVAEHCRSTTDLPPYTRLVPCGAQLQDAGPSPHLSADGELGCYLWMCERGVGRAHCCLERQKREAMEPRENPCFFCWESSVRRCSSSWQTNGSSDWRTPNQTTTNVFGFFAHLCKLSLSAFEGLYGVILQSVVLQYWAHIVHPAQSNGWEKSASQQHFCASIQ